MIKRIYQHESARMQKANDYRPDQMLVELVTCFERLLCYCHTGNAAVLATSLMHPLGLSRGILKDGSPVLMPSFEQRSIIDAVKTGFKIDPERWPVKKGYPAVASKRCQELTYNEKHFQVSIIRLTGYETSLYALVI